jgi:hypothetical protein
VLLKLTNALSAKMISNQCRNIKYYLIAIMNIMRTVLINGLRMRRDVLSVTKILKFDIILPIIIILIVK